MLGVLLCLSPAIARRGWFGSMAEPGMAFAAESPAEPSRKSPLRLGPPKPAAVNRVSVSLEFAPPERAKVNQIRAEILLPAGPWRFRKAEATEGAGLKISVQQRREEQTASPGEKRATTVLALVISGGKQDIAAGPVGELFFSLVPKEAAPPIALVVRKVETAPSGPGAPPEPPPLEPPQAYPPANPAPTCFFFTH